MSQVATPPTEDEIFSADAYALPIPTTEGRKAQRISVRFTGSCELDRTSEDDLVFLEAMRLGVPVRLVITGLPVGKGFSLSQRRTRPTRSSPITVLYASLPSSWGRSPERPGGSAECARRDARASPPRTFQQMRFANR